MADALTIYDLHPAATYVPARDVRPGDLYLDAVGPALVLTSGGKLAVTPGGRRCIGRQFTCRYVWEPDPAATWRVGPFDPDAPVRIAERTA